MVFSLNPVPLLRIVDQTVSYVITARHICLPIRHDDGFAQPARGPIRPRGKYGSDTRGGLITTIPGHDFRFAKAPRASKFSLCSASCLAKSPAFAIPGFGVRWTQCGALRFANSPRRICYPECSGSEIRQINKCRSATTC